MKAQDIVDQLSKVLPLYTSGFSNSLPILSAQVSGAIVTVTTDGSHGLEDQQAVAVTGIKAPVQIDVTSFRRTGSTAQFKTLQQHDLTLSERDKANGGKTITISGANEVEFNGTFQLLRVINRGGAGEPDSLVIAVDDVGPAAITGSPLVGDANGSIFNGLKAATVVDDATFTYELAQAYPLDGVTTGAEVQVSIRITAALDIREYMEDVYTAKGLDDDTLVVQLGDVVQSKKRNEQTDAADSSSGQYSYNSSLIQPFAVYVVLNVTDELTGSCARDIVESEYIPAIFRAVLRASFDTGFSYSGFRATFTGHGVFAYSDDLGKNKAVYAHEITFEQLVQLTSADTADTAETVAMRDVDYTLTTNTGSSQLAAAVNLDEDAEPEP